MLAKTLIYETAAVEAVWRTWYPVTAARTIKWYGYRKGKVARYIRNEDVRVLGQHFDLRNASRENTHNSQKRKRTNEPKVYGDGDLSYL